MDACGLTWRLADRVGSHWAFGGALAFAEPAARALPMGAEALDVTGNFPAHALAGVTGAEDLAQAARRSLSI